MGNVPSVTENIHYVISQRTHEETKYLYVGTASFSLYPRVVLLIIVQKSVISCTIFNHHEFVHTQTHTHTHIKTKSKCILDFAE